MAITASFITTIGTKTWEVSRKKVLNISSLSTSYELEAEKNNAVEGSPLTNLRGKKKEPLSFSSTFNASCGIDVKAEFESWKEYVGKAGVLRFGNERFSSHSWLLTAVKGTNTQLDDAGRWRSIKVAFTFEESDDTSADELAAASSAVEESGSAVSITAPTDAKAAKKPDNPLLQIKPITAARATTIVGSTIPILNVAIRR